MATNKRLNRKVRNSYLISTFSISMVLFLLGSVGYLMYTAMDVADMLRGSIKATVELKSGLTETQRDAIRHAVAKYPLASEVSFSSKEQKINNEEFREMFGLEFEKVLEDNPLMDSFEVSLSAEVSDIKQLEAFASSVDKIAGVERVTYPAVLVEQVHSTVEKFQYVILLFGGALLFVSLVLLNSTIRMAIFSKRGIINTMKLVGATRWFILRPFMWSGLWSGFWAGVMASVLFAGAIYALRETLPGVLTMAELERAGYIAGAMIGGGMLISMIFTWMSVNRFVNMRGDKIHLY